MQSFLNKLKNTRLLLTLLALSVACNIFLAALVGGAMLGKRFPLFVFAHSQINEALGNLPAARQKEIREIVRHNIFPYLKRSFAIQEKLRRAVSYRLAEPDVSREALEKDFSDIREATSRTQKQMQDRFIDIILMLSPQERLALSRGVRSILR